MKPRASVLALERALRVGPDTNAVRARLIASYQDFLAFVQERVGSRALAQGILQDAFVCPNDGLDDPADDESATAWFVRRLRNAVLDYQRRHEITTHSLVTFAEELAEELAEGSAAAVKTCRVVWQSMARLTRNLEPVYAQALQRIEADGLAVETYASEEGIKSHNVLVVQVFLAREGLKRQIVLACMSGTA
jgi:DNA-directed RNA polymerase specialized sigma24 family protein